MSILLLFLIYHVSACPTSLPITITSLVWSPEHPTVGWGASAVISGYSQTEAWVDVNACQIDIITHAGTTSSGLLPCFYGLEQHGRDVKIQTGVWRLPEEAVTEGVHTAEIKLIGREERLQGCFQASITLLTASNSSSCPSTAALTFSYLTWVATDSGFSLLLEGRNDSRVDSDLSSCLLTWSSGSLPFPCYAGAVPRGTHFRVQSDNIALQRESAEQTGQIIGLSEAGDIVACWSLSSLSP
jgi:hypothetical protein